MNNAFKLVFIACMLPGACTAQKNTDPGNVAPNFTVVQASEWSQLFKRKTGWFGGDGIFALALNGKEKQGSVKSTDSVIIWFSDTMLGDIVNDTLQPGFVMIHNSVSLLQGNQPLEDKIHFYWKQDAQNKPQSVFAPQTPDTQHGDYYWMGDAFVNQEKNNDIYMFGYRIKDTGTGSFGFAEMGNTLIVIPHGQQPPFAQTRQIDVPFFTGIGETQIGSFGAGIFVNTKAAGATKPDEYVYIYGVRGTKKSVIVARVHAADIENFGKWMFWDGAQWTGEAAKAANITDRTSNELSVTELPNGRYAMVFQVDGMGKQVGMRVGASPAGPFGPVIPLWDCSLDLNPGKNFFCYNAKAHPVLSGSNELVISYNINSFDFFNDIKKYPNLYRPRFIRVKFEQWEGIGPLPSLN